MDTITHDKQLADKITHYKDLLQDTLMAEFNANLDCMADNLVNAGTYGDAIEQLLHNDSLCCYDRACMASSLDMVSDEVYTAGLPIYAGTDNPTDLQLWNYGDSDAIHNIVSEYMAQLAELARELNKEAHHNILEAETGKLEMKAADRDCEMAYKCLSVMKNEKPEAYTHRDWITIMCAFKSCGGSADYFARWTLQAYDEANEDHASQIRYRFNSVSDLNKCGIGTLLMHAKRFEPKMVKEFIDKNNIILDEIEALKVFHYDLPEKAIPLADQPKMEDAETIEALVNDSCGYNLKKLGKDIDVETYDEQWMRGYNINKYNILAHISPLGSGKTQSLKTILKDKPSASVLYLSNRILFAYNIADEFHEYGFKSYTDIEGKITHNRVICSVESITRVKRKYDIVVMDESEALLSIFSSSTCGTSNSPLKYIVSKFQGLMVSAQHIIACDAFMTDRTLNFLKAIRRMRNKTRRNMIVSINQRTPELKKAYKMKKKQLMNEIMLNATKGTRFCVVAGTKSFARDVKKMIKDISDLKVLCYTGDTQDTGEEGKNTIRDVRKNWTAADVVIYTSCITTGVNFDVHNHFEKLFVYGSANTCVVRDTFQSMMRVRKTMSRDLYFTADGRKGTVSSFKRKSQLIDAQDTDIKSWLRDIHEFTVKECATSRHFYGEMFNCFLKKMNYEVIDKSTATSTVQDSTADETITTDVGELTYADIPVITARELEAIKHRIDNNETVHLDREKAKKFYMLQRISTTCPADEDRDTTPEEDAWKFISSSDGEGAQKRALNHVLGVERIREVIEQEKEAKTWNVFMRRHVKAMMDIHTLIDVLGLDMNGTNNIREFDMYPMLPEITPIIERIEATLEDTHTYNNKKLDDVNRTVGKINYILRKHMGLTCKSVNNEKGNTKYCRKPKACTYTTKAKGKFFHLKPVPGCKAVFHRLTENNDE